MRMKHVFRKNEVFHIWASQSQQDGRSSGGGKVFFVGDTIYSYGHHFPMGRIIMVREERVALITTRTYSSTASVHVRATWRAVHNILHFGVPNIEANSVVEHKDNWKDIMDRCYQHVEKARGARVWIESYTNQAISLECEADQYAATFGLGVPPVGYVISVLPSLLDKIERSRVLRDPRGEEAQKVLGGVA